MTPHDPVGGPTDEEELAAERVETDLQQLAAEAVDGSEAIKHERDELRALAQRVQADFENYRKRVMRDQADTAQRATEGLVEQLLPVLDAFELAVGSLTDVGAQVRKGVELVYAQLLSVLERAGLERIATDGAAFDPNVHEAVLHEEGDGDQVVTETMRTGYRLKDKVIRPAMVRVGRGPTPREAG